MENKDFNYFEYRIRNLNSPSTSHNAELYNSAYQLDYNVYMPTWDDVKGWYKSNLESKGEKFDEQSTKALYDRVNEDYRQYSDGEFNAYDIDAYIDPVYSSIKSPVAWVNNLKGNPLKLDMTQARLDELSMPLQRMDVVGGYQPFDIKQAIASNINTKQSNIAGLYKYKDLAQSAKDNFEATGVMYEIDPATNQIRLDSEGKPMPIKEDPDDYSWGFDGIFSPLGFLDVSSKSSDYTWSVQSLPDTGQAVLVRAGDNTDVYKIPNQISRWDSPKLHTSTLEGILDSPLNLIPNLFGNGIKFLGTAIDKYGGIEPFIFDEESNGFGKALYRWGNNIAAGTNRDIGGMFDNIPSFFSNIANVAESYTRFGTVALLAGPSAAMGWAYTEAFSSGYIEAKQSGWDEKEAAVFGTSMGLVAAISSGLLQGSTMKGLHKIFKGASPEANEVLSQIVKDTSKWFVKSITPFIKEGAKKSADELASTLVKESNRLLPKAIDKMIAGIIDKSNNISNKHWIAKAFIKHGVPEGFQELSEFGGEVFVKSMFRDHVWHAKGDNFLTDWFARNTVKNPRDVRFETSMKAGYNSFSEKTWTQLMKEGAETFLLGMLGGAMPGLLHTYSARNNPDNSLEAEALVDAVLTKGTKKADWDKAYDVEVDLIKKGKSSLGNSSYNIKGEVVDKTKPDWYKETQAYKVLDTTKKKIEYLYALKDNLQLMGVDKRIKLPALRQAMVDLVSKHDVEKEYYLGYLDLYNTNKELNEELDKLGIDPKKPLEEFSIDKAFVTALAPEINDLVTKLGIEGFDMDDFTKELGSTVDVSTIQTSSLMESMQKSSHANVFNTALALERLKLSKLYYKPKQGSLYKLDKLYDAAIDLLESKLAKAKDDYNINKIADPTIAEYENVREKLIELVAKTEAHKLYTIDEMVLISAQDTLINSKMRKIKDLMDKETDATRKALLESEFKYLSSLSLLGTGKGAGHLLTPSMRSKIEEVLVHKAISDKNFLDLDWFWIYTDLELDESNNKGVLTLPDGSVLAFEDKGAITAKFELDDLDPSGNPIKRDFIFEVKDLNKRGDNSLLSIYAVIRGLSNTISAYNKFINDPATATLTPDEFKAKSDEFRDSINSTKEAFNFIKELMPNNVDANNVSDFGNNLINLISDETTPTAGILTHSKLLLDFINEFDFKSTIQFVTDPTLYQSITGNPMPAIDPSIYSNEFINEFIKAYSVENSTNNQVLIDTDPNTGKYTYKYDTIVGSENVNLSVEVSVQGSTLSVSKDISGNKLDSLINELDNKVMSRVTNTDDLKSIVSLSNSETDLTEFIKTLAYNKDESEYDSKGNLNVKRNRLSLGRYKEELQEIWADKLQPKSAVEMAKVYEDNKANFDNDPQLLIEYAGDNGKEIINEIGKVFRARTMLDMYKDLQNIATSTRLDTYLSDIEMNTVHVFDSAINTSTIKSLMEYLALILKADKSIYDIDDNVSKRHLGASTMYMSNLIDKSSNDSNSYIGRLFAGNANKKTELQDIVNELLTGKTMADAYKSYVKLIQFISSLAVNVEDRGTIMSELFKAHIELVKSDRVAAGVSTSVMNANIRNAINAFFTKSVVGLDLINSTKSPDDHLSISNFNNIMPIASMLDLAFAYKGNTALEYETIEAAVRDAIGDAHAAGFTPTMEQRIALLQSTASLHTNVKVYEKVQKDVKEIYEKEFANASAINKPKIQDNPIAKSIVYIPGWAGSGKTTMVAKYLPIIYDAINGTTPKHISGPRLGHREKLKSIIPTADLYDTPMEAIYDINGSGRTGLIIIDEAGLESPDDFHKYVDAVNTTNSRIILMGDETQMMGKVKKNGKMVDISYTEHPIRTGNLHKVGDKYASVIPFSKQLSIRLRSGLAVHDKLDSFMENAIVNAVGSDSRINPQLFLDPEYLDAKDPNKLEGVRYSFDLATFSARIDEMVKAGVDLSKDFKLLYHNETKNAELDAFIKATIAKYPSMIVQSVSDAQGSEVKHVFFVTFDKEVTNINNTIRTAVSRRKQFLEMMVSPAFDGAAIATAKLNMKAIPESTGLQRFTGLDLSKPANKAKATARNKYLYDLMNSGGSTSNTVQSNQPTPNTPTGPSTSPTGGTSNQPTPPAPNAPSGVNPNIDPISPLSNKKFVLPGLGEINTGILGIATLPTVDLNRSFNVNIDGADETYYLKTNYSKLQGRLLSRNDNWLFQHNERFVVLMKVGELYMPFYMSSQGTSGKTKGDWYPMFGVSPTGWYMKGSVNQSNGKMGLYEKDPITNTLVFKPYSDSIEEATNLLNDNLSLTALQLVNPVNGYIEDANKQPLVDVHSLIKPYFNPKNQNIVNEIAGYTVAREVDRGYEGSDKWKKFIIDIIEGNVPSTTVNTNSNTNTSTSGVNPLVSGQINTQPMGNTNTPSTNPLMDADNNIVNMTVDVNSNDDDDFDSAVASTNAC